MNNLLLTVDGDSAFADQNFDAVFLVEAFAHQRQLFGGVVREVRREVYAVISDARFFTENGNIKVGRIRFIKKIFDKAMADHTVTDNCESDFAHFCLDFFSITAYLNDSATPLIDVNQIHLYILLKGYISDLYKFS